MTQHGIIYSFYCDQCYGCYLLKSPKDRLNLESLQFSAGDMEKDQGIPVVFIYIFKTTLPREQMLQISVQKFTQVSFCFLFFNLWNNFLKTLFLNKVFPDSDFMKTGCIKDLRVQIYLILLLI